MLSDKILNLTISLFGIIAFCFLLTFLVFVIIKSYNEGEIIPIIICSFFFFTFMGFGIAGILRILGY